GAWVALLTGDALGVSHLVKVVEAASEREVLSPGDTASLHALLASIRGTLAPRGVSQMLADGELLCTAEGRRGGTRWVTDGWRQIGTAHLLAGRSDEASAAFAEALALTQGHPDRNHLAIY